MTEPDGGFRSATDADSDGREGVYFVWTKPELEKLLGKDAALFEGVYGVTADGNFEDPHHPRAKGEPGMNVLHVARPIAEVAGRFSKRGRIAPTLASTTRCWRRGTRS